MSLIYENCILSVKRSKKAFYRYITANDVGTTGGHQYGFYVPKEAHTVLFDAGGKKGSNKDKHVRIYWQGDKSFFTDSRFIYYGKGTRNEYRITRFGRDFPFLSEESIGSLLVLCRLNDTEYEGYVLENSNEIDDFFSTFNLSPSASHSLIDNTLEKEKEDKESSYTKFVLNRYEEFPSTVQMAFWAQKFHLIFNKYTRRRIYTDPDAAIIKWIDKEYDLFKAFEEKFYRPIYTQCFESCDDLIVFANHILNRRKSRAGKSLELHLARVFHCSGLSFDSQLVTEQNKKPDFIFPGNNSYHEISFPNNKLIMLAAKTTCKDRWRQILNEANKIGHKYLFTLQQGISPSQLAEMKSENVTLVVPKAYLNSFSARYQDSILTLKSFVEMAIEKTK